MPLRAQIDGRSVNAALLSDTEWQVLKGSRCLRMPCCDTVGYPRTSRGGIRHFAHSPGSHCGGKGESSEHLAAKAEIVRACHEVGWDVQSEFAGDTWRADVYATRGRHQVAFEVQWSSQTLEETRMRQAAYGSSVKCCWLFRKFPLPAGRRSGSYGLETISEATLPIFCLSLTDSGYSVKVDRQQVSLREFVHARLAGRIQFRDARNYPLREVQLIVFKEKCPRHSDYDVFYTRHLLRSHCGGENVDTDPGEKRCFQNDPHSALRNWRLVKRVFADEVQNLRVSVKFRRSNTAGRSYWCFGCPECNWFMGDHFFILRMMDAENKILCSKVLPHSESQPEPHWCFPQNGRFCAKRVLPISYM